MMYTQQELAELRTQKKKRILCVWVPVILLAAAIIAVLIIRGVGAMEDQPAQILVDLFTILGGVILIAGWGMVIKPLRCYERHMDNLLNGRTHVFEEGTFSQLEEDISMVDGVAYYAMTLHCLDQKNKPYERLFYYDALKPRPDFTEGEPLRVVYHDRFIGQVERR